MAQKLIAHQVQDARPVRQIRPDVPPALAAVIAPDDGEEAGRPATSRRPRWWPRSTPWAHDPPPLPTRQEIPDRGGGAGAAAVGRLGFDPAGRRIRARPRPAAGPGIAVRHAAIARVSPASSADPGRGRGAPARRPRPPNAEAGQRGRRRRRSCRPPRRTGWSAGRTRRSASRSPTATESPDPAAERPAPPDLVAVVGLAWPSLVVAWYVAPAAGAACGSPQRRRPRPPTEPATARTRPATRAVSASAGRPRDRRLCAARPSVGIMGRCLATPGGRHARAAAGPGLPPPPPPRARPPPRRHTRTPSSSSIPYRITRGPPVTLTPPALRVRCSSSPAAGPSATVQLAARPAEGAAVRWRSSPSWPPRLDEALFLDSADLPRVPVRPRPPAGVHRLLPDGPGRDPRNCSGACSPAPAAPGCRRPAPAVAARPAAGRAPAAHGLRPRRRHLRLGVQGAGRADRRAGVRDRRHVALLAAPVHPDPEELRDPARPGRDGPGLHRPAGERTTATRLFDDPCAHLPEHSIELEVVLLQYLFEGRRPFRIVPLLVGSFRRPRRGASPTPPRRRTSPGWWRPCGTRRRRPASRCVT